MTLTGITNWPAPARLTVGVVSAGAVGTALGQALEAVGHVVGAVSARSDTNRARVSVRLPESQIVPPERVATLSELLILSVPDTELAGVVDSLADSGSVRPGTIVVHTAGAHGIGILSPLTAAGVTPLAIHPAMTFVGTADDTARLPTACFGVTAADDVGYAVAQALVLEMGGEPVRIREEVRPLYHAALAHAANHLVALISDSVAALRIVLAGQEFPGQEPVDGERRGIAERVVAPLVTAALTNVLELGPAALTGPAARGDADMVATHLAALSEADPMLARAYRDMARRAAAYSTEPVAGIIDLVEDD